MKKKKKPKTFHLGCFFFWFLLLLPFKIINNSTEPNSFSLKVCFSTNFIFFLHSPPATRIYFDFWWINRQTLTHIRIGKKKSSAEDFSINRSHCLCYVYRPWKLFKEEKKKKKLRKLQIAFRMNEFSTIIIRIIIGIHWQKNPSRFPQAYHQYAFNHNL